MELKAFKPSSVTAVLKIKSLQSWDAIQKVRIGHDLNFKPHVKITNEILPQGEQL
jgi:hypothetical protein